MSYLTQTRIAADPNVILRIAACATGEGIPAAQFWVQERMLEFATSSGWGAAYAASEGDDPGADEAAITDQMILGAVRSLRAADTTPPQPETPTSPAE